MQVTAHLKWIHHFSCMKFNAFVILMISMTALIGCNRNIYDSATIRQLPKEEYLAKLASTPGAYLLDIRTGMEYRRAHIDGAVSMSLLSSAFDDRIAELDTARPVFLYCETAHRSPFATMKLKKAGSTEIYDLEKGYSTIRE